MTTCANECGRLVKIGQMFCSVYCYDQLNNELAEKARADQRKYRKGYTYDSSITSTLL